MANYHEPSSCNKCSGENQYLQAYFDEYLMVEVKTKCKDCGFDDYWAYGFFESSEDMVSNCKKYNYEVTV